MMDADFIEKCDTINVCLSRMEIFSFEETGGDCNDGVGTGLKSGPAKLIRSI